MDHIVLLIYLFPIVFMLHDFEEIIMQQRWMERNADELCRRFPVLRKQIMQLRELSTTGFAIAVAEEFIIISGVSVYAVLSRHYFLWMALFLAFGIHLLVHVGQFVLLRRYIPAIVTSLLCLPYAVYVCYFFYFFYSTGLFTAMDLLLSGILGVLIMVLNLKLAHALGRRLDALI